MLGFVAGGAPAVLRSAASTFAGHRVRSPLPHLPPTSRRPYSAAPRSIPRRALYARIDRSDEGFVSCNACGADVLVAVSAFSKRSNVAVRCSECGGRWQASPSELFTLDGSANIVSSEKRREEEEAAVQAGERPVKLYVAGLGPKVTKEALKDAFTEFGDVDEAVVIFDRVTGRSRGFAFVTMANASCAEAAMSVMHESSKLGGRRISVRLARDG